MSTATALEIIPRPVHESGLLVVETSRMQPVGAYQPLLAAVMSGKSREQVCDELNVSSTAFEIAQYQLKNRKLDSRNWTEAGRIAIETGTIPILKRQESTAEKLPNGMQVLYDQMSRGYTRYDLAHIWALSLNAVGQIQRDLYEAVGVSGACIPEAALAYAWYASGRASQRSDARKRFIRMKSLWNTRHLLDKAYPGFRCTYMEDADTVRVMDALPAIFEAGDMRQDTKQHLRMLAYVKGGQSFREIAAVEGISEDLMHRTAKHWYNRLRGMGGPEKILSLAGVDSRLPCKKVPPLSSGLTWGRRRS